MGVDLVEYYLVFGVKEGCWFLVEFDGDWYLKRNIDVVKFGMNLFLYFLKYGKSEKRVLNRFFFF